METFEGAAPGFAYVKMDGGKLRFRNQEVLRGVTWDVQTGQRVGLVHYTPVRYTPLRYTPLRYTPFDTPPYATHPCARYTPFAHATHPCARYTPLHMLHTLAHATHP